MGLTFISKNFLLLETCNPIIYLTKNYKELSLTIDYSCNTIRKYNCPCERDRRDGGYEIVHDELGQR